MGSKVVCARVSRAAENASVSSTRGAQRLRARPMKSSREVRNPSGARSEARKPMAFACLSRARTARRWLEYSSSANSRLYWVCPRSASGWLRTHSRYGTTLIGRARSERFSNVIVQSSAAIVGPGQ